ncbi:hypothetical protein MNBD_PLANCTO02-2832 [hydrothermal vent metagenome]|uniref:Uncharacterized protein n=1 Tax=hydrothermal vent metagenome TaxID=652676 RepID=A0A3B1DI85_9ZZZZ
MPLWYQESRNFSKDLSPMSHTIHSARLPLKLSVVPATVSRWLRVAGIPVAPFEPIANNTTQNISGETVLYDSRSAASRSSIEAVRNKKAILIDIAPLLAMNQTEAAHQTENHSTEIWQQEVTTTETSFFKQGRLFLERLKKEVEKQGGCWIRLADYPFPYLSVLCIGTIPHEEMICASDVAFAPFPANEEKSKEQSEALLVARKWYAAGSPFFIPTNQAGKTLFKLESPPEGFPLLWRTTFEEFLHWRRLRMQATFCVQLFNGVYHIDSDHSFGRYRPQVELWRGGHVASFRLFGAGMSVREEGLVFQQEQGRHPSGFSAHLLYGESLVTENSPTQPVTTNPPLPHKLRFRSGT